MMLGVMISARARKATAGLLATMLTITIASFAGLFYVRTFLLYLLLFSLASFCINYCYNIFDMFLAKSTAPEGQDRHVRTLLGCQMAGYVISPLFFSYFAEQPVVCISFAVLAGIVSFLPVCTSYAAWNQKESTTGQNSTLNKNDLVSGEIASHLGKDIRAFHEKWLDQDTLPMAYCFFIYAAVYMFMPSIAYL